MAKRRRKRNDKALDRLNRRRFKQMSPEALAAYNAFRANDFLPEEAGAEAINADYEARLAKLGIGKKRRPKRTIKSDEPEPRETMRFTVCIDGELVESFDFWSDAIRAYAHARDTSTGRVELLDGFTVFRWRAALKQ